MAAGVNTRDIIRKPCVLLVEGQDDYHFFETLAKKLELSETIQVQELRGRNNLRPQLKAIFQTSTSDEVEIRSLAVALDAESNFGSTFELIRNALRDANFPIPSQPLVKHGNKPQVICMVFPDNQKSGMLEDLCLVPFANDPAIECLDQYITCLNENNALLSENIAKAKIRAFLASKPKSETRLGHATQSDWWPWSHPAFDQVKYFLQEIASSAEG